MRPASTRENRLSLFLGKIDCPFFSGESPVQKAQVSARTKAKAARKRTAEGLPVHNLQTLLADLATLTLNQVTLPDAPDHPFPMFAKPTPLQQKAFDLLGVDPTRFVASNLAG